MLARIIQGILILALSANAYAKKKPQYFKQTEFETAIEITHPIMTANFVGDQQQEILLIGLNEKAEKVMEIYGLNSETAKFDLITQVEIPSSTIAFDLLANQKGNTRALLLSNSELSLVNFETLEQVFVNTQLPDDERLELRRELEEKLQRTKN